MKIFPFINTQPIQDDAPEKRRDPNEPKSKKTYTKKEFVDEYGKKEGEALWKKAAPAKKVCGYLCNPLSLCCKILLCGR